MKIVIDTREKKPYPFKGYTKRRKALESGDYSILGHTKKIIIERKSLSDLYGTLTVQKNLVRFKKELTRLSRVPHWFIIVDSSAESVSKGSRYSRANGFAVLCLAFELVFQYGGKVLFAKSRKEAELLILAMFTGYLKHQKN